MINLINKENHPNAFNWLINQTKINNWVDTIDADEDFYWKSCQLVFHITESSSLPIDYHGYWATEDLVQIEMPDYTVDDIDEIVAFRRVIKQSKEVIKTEVFYTEI